MMGFIRYKLPTWSALNVVSFWTQESSLSTFIQLKCGFSYHPFWSRWTCWHLCHCLKYSNIGLFFCWLKCHETVCKALLFFPFAPLRLQHSAKPFLVVFSTFWWGLNLFWSICSLIPLPYPCQIPVDVSTIMCLSTQCKHFTSYSYILHSQPSQKGLLKHNGLCLFLGIFANR
jgi:hypothetical protein